MRVAAYVRVSKERDGMISPDIQRQQIADYAKRLGAPVMATYEDLDISGRKFEQRPDLQRLLADVRAGAWDVVIVYRLDRFSREPRHYYPMVYEIEQAGVELHDASEGRYFPGPEMGMLRGVKILVAWQESINIGMRMRDMHADLARAGKHASGKTPFGWERVRDPDGQQRLVLVPGESEWRRQMHEWLWEGKSIRAIAKALDAANVSSPRAARWREASVHRMLGQISQIGATVRDGQEYITGRIEPMLTREEYERSQAVLRSRKHWPERRSSHAIRGNLVRCGNCGHTLYLHKNREANKYRCEGYLRHACPHGASIYESVLLREVEPELFKHLARLRRPVVRRTPSVRLEPLLAQEKAAAETLGRLVAMYAGGQISEAEWTAGRMAANKKLGIARERLEKARGSLTVPRMDETDYVYLRSVTPEVWRSLSYDGQHAILRALIDYIEVNPVDSEKKRVRIHWR